MFSSTLTIAIGVFVPALILLFISFYRRTPGAGGPSLGGPNSDGPRVSAYRGRIRVRSLGSP